MPVLNPNEYDASYFDGATQAMRHNAGYSSYKRWFRNGSDNFKDIASSLLNEQSLHNLKILEIGCAKGFIVEDLNDLGVDAYGIDVSDYAINTAPDAATVRRPDLASKFIVGDATTALSAFKRNEFDFVFSLRFLPCIADADLPGLIDELNRITRRNQVHVIDEFPEGRDGTYYNVHLLEEWQAMGFKVGTRFISQEDQARSLVK